MDALTEEERRLIENLFQPLGGSNDSLTKGAITQSNERALNFLSNLATWFIKDESRHIAYKILKKAEIYIPTSRKVLDVHFFYLSKIKIFYRDRDKPEYLEEAKSACRDQIALAPQAAKAFKREFKEGVLPAHTGYMQLAIILARESKHEEVIQLCEQARKQGWSGDWDKRIERSRKSIKK